MKQPVKLYKVLRVKMNLRKGTLRVEPTAMHTNYSEYLPDGMGNPGRWTRAVKHPVVCVSGWHLTTNPVHYLEQDRDSGISIVYEAEGRGPTGGTTRISANSNNGNSPEIKYCFSQIRLLRRVSRNEWPKIWRDRVEP